MASKKQLKVNVTYLRRHLSELLNDVRFLKEDVLITKHGKVWAKLVRASAPRIKKVKRKKRQKKK
ncbi:MAG TPA: type II toxin-antitoxin system prevent-host-death family antitoxin [candidate division WWE3 bacterium]|uniref:Antitoxin n=1 Tax=candidate division WWE3 bacterium TaxID=2053526 RepID=A0A7V5J1J8_UNCKA|nr:type II toxin-antitoxin system prevent-host-death family antitoxin [candidate division WWE3 bacterium]